VFNKWRVLLIAGCFLVLPAVVCACLWDYDTLMMERQRFPSALELITGKFLRHTPEFYQWRIQDRLAKLKTDPDNLAYYDDLAVAYNKVGQHKKAIETILIKEQKKPGLYETYANLGTFLFYTSDFEKSLEYIDRAIAINPDAHFGREKYQKYLTRYIIDTRKVDKLQLPMGHDVNDYKGFDLYLALQENSARLPRQVLSEEQHRAAVKGVLGMMKFANYDSPILLEVLGDLLRWRDAHFEEVDAKRLAARAYLKASYEVPDESAKKAYRDLAEKTLKYQTRNPATYEQVSLHALEQSFQKELGEATKWYEQLRNNELEWIREGKNPEIEFARLYYGEPEVLAVNSEEEAYTWRDNLANYLGRVTGWEPALINNALPGVARLMVATLLLLSGVWLFWWARRRRRKKRLARTQELGH
jgi:tetratricopeptide (TPR) repeat protein